MFKRKERGEGKRGERTQGGRIRGKEAEGKQESTRSKLKEDIRGKNGIFRSFPFPFN